MRRAVLPSQLSVLLSPFEDLRLGIVFFQSKEVLFEFQSQSEACQAAVRPEYPVAGDYDEKWIAAHRVTDTPVSLMFQSEGERFVGGCLAIRNFSRLQPDFPLVGSADKKIERKRSKILSFSLEIPFEKLFFCREPLIVELEENSLFCDGAFDLLERILVLQESGEAHPFFGFGQENSAFRDIQEGVIQRQGLNSQSESLRKSGRQSGFQDFSLGFSDFILHAVELDFFCVGVVNGKSGPVVPVPGLSD